MDLWRTMVESFTAIDRGENCPSVPIHEGLLYEGKSEVTDEIRIEKKGEMDGVQEVQTQR